MYENSACCLPPWRSVTTTVPGGADSQAGHWVTFLPCTSFPQFTELIQSSWSLWECCSYLLCAVGQVLRAPRGNHPWLVQVISLERGEGFCWFTQHDPANMWQWQSARRASGAPAAPATSPEPVTSAVAGRQLSASCSVCLYHFFCLHPSLLLVK